MEQKNTRTNKKIWHKIEKNEKGKNNLDIFEGKVRTF